MLKRWLIIVPALAGVFAILGLGYWGYGLLQENQQMQIYMNSRNQRAFYEMMGSVQNVEAMLSKGVVSNSPNQRMMIFADVWQQAYTAHENLTQIPVAGPSVTRTSRFLTQTGDFAWTLAKKYSRGATVNPEELAKLNRLHTEAGFLAAELQKIEKSAGKGWLSWAELKSGSDAGLRKEAPAVPMGLQQIDRTMQEFPTLIYDGPFSDHIINRKPRNLPGGKIGGDQARTIARNFVETGTETKYKVVRTENVNGIIPAFRIYLTPQQGETPVVIVDIAKQGGHILFMLNNRAVNQAKISRQRAIELANKFLQNAKIRNMKPTYVIEQQNTGVVIFQYEQDGVLIYPDLMKVKVALDTGNIVGFEGMGFAMNHTERKLAKPKISEPEALKAVNSNLKIETKRLAVIPLENLQEILTYEFKGTLNGDTFIVYINALTGQEERIVKIIETNSGPVTM